MAGKLIQWACVGLIILSLLGTATIAILAGMAVFAPHGGKRVDLQRTKS